MNAKAAGKVLVVVIALIFLGSMFSCAGREFAPKDPYPYWYYPKELPEASRAIEAARQQGKDKACPKEFAEAEARVDKAYQEYMTCITPGPIPINIVCGPPTCELKSDKAKIDLGESATVSLTTSDNVTSAVLDGTEVAPTGVTKRVTPISTTTYTATIKGPAGSNTCSVPVQVILPPPPTCELKSDKGKIDLGESATLSLTTSGKVIAADLDGTEVAPTGGTKKIQPTSDACSYYATVVGPGGSNTCSVSVQVITPPPPTCVLKSDKGKIDVGESATLSLTTSGKVTSAVLDGTEVGPTGGTKKIEPTSAKTYTATVVG